MFTEKSEFQGGELMKNQYRGGGFSKRGWGAWPGQFADLRWGGGLVRKRGWCFLRGGGVIP